MHGEREVLPLIDCPYQRRPFIEKEEGRKEEENGKYVTLL